MKKLKPFHPLADVLPLIEGAEFDRLVADIAEHGLLNPITLFEGKILDGRNRARACEAAGIEPRYVEFEGDAAAAIAFVISQNLTRRHLGPSERAMVAARLATLADGQRQVGKFAYVPTQEQAAKLVNVSERSIKSARVVLEHGTPELVQAVEHGRLAVHEAAKAARETPAAQADFLEAVAAGVAPTAWHWNHSRTQHAAALAATTRALPVGAKSWPIILADPPWRRDIDMSTPSRAIDNQYPTMSLEDIKTLPVSDLATNDAVLFLWATTIMLPQALEVITAWGFEYITSLVWDKEVAGTGFWVRNQHEILLLAIRGSPPKPPTKAAPASVIRERRREHSRKPEASYAIIERMYPTLPKLELFARQARPGWDVWGNETEKFGQAPSADDGLDIPASLRRSG